MKRILITGASGYIGRRLVEHFSNIGIAVRATAHTAVAVERLKASGIETVQWSLDSSSNCEFLLNDVSVVYHLACPRYAPGTDNRYAPTRTGGLVEGTERLVQAFEKSAASRFIFTGSAAVYGKFQGEINENTTPRPQTQYAQAKLDIENCLKRVMSSDMTRLVIARLPAVDGPENSRYTEFEKNVASGRFRIIGTGNALHQSISIDDAIEALSRCSTVGEAGGETLLVAGYPMTFKQKVMGVAEKHGVSFRTTPKLENMSVAALKLMSIYPSIAARCPKIYNTLAFQVRSFSYDVSRSIAVLGEYRAPQCNRPTGLNRIAQKIDKN